MSAIDQLEQVMWSQVITQSPATDDDTIRRWYEDDLVHLKERYRVAPMDESNRELVNAAIAEWSLIQVKFTENAGFSEDEFLERFTQLREWKLENVPQAGVNVAQLSQMARGVVKNMDWVNLFSWILPQADPKHKLAHLLWGRMVTGIYYVELLGKQNISTVGSGDNPITRVDARWRYMDELESE